MRILEIDRAWEANSQDVIAAVTMAIDMGLSRQKWKTAAEVKRDFFVHMAKEAFRSGCRIGYARAQSEQSSRTPSSMEADG